MPATFATDASEAIPLHVLEADAAPRFIAGLPSAQRAWVEARGFEGKLGQICEIPGEAGVAQVLYGFGDEKARARDRLHLGALPTRLPRGTYRLEGIEGRAASQAALAWLLGSYSFARYKEKPAPKARLLAPKGVDPTRIETIAAADALTRDLINTPACDMGPEALEAAFRELAASHGAQVSVIRGEALLEQGFPLIHTVGRAAAEAPRLLEMRWGEAEHPKVTLVGKGVCFDTGGLNLKPGSSMALMKKDMGGAATVMGLARMIMALGLPVRLRVLVPAVENAIGTGAFRPGDVLRSRKGLTVEVNNTDAEGRLVLADALALADEEAPDLLICKATLTGAARVALGPDVMPFWCDDDTLAGEIARAAEAVEDPLWRLPFWAPYEEMIEPDIADLDNAPSGGFAGAITAALFLRRFVENAAQFVHMDIFGWTPKAKPGRPKGGACMGARAMLEVIEGRLR